MEGRTNFSDYDYDYADSDLPLEEIIPVGIVYGTTLVLGIVGNALVIFSVSRYQQMKTITNTFLLSLASADLLLVLVCIPVKCAGFFSYTWEFGEILCKGVHYIQNVSAICSVTTLTAMSLERYYAILHPMKAKYYCSVGRAKRAIVALWAVSLVLAAPIILGMEHVKVGTVKTGFWCIKQWPKVILSKLYEIFMLLIILIVPSAVMIFAYASICKELWAVTDMAFSNNSRSDSAKRFPDVARSCDGTPVHFVGSEKSPVIRVKKSTDDDKTRKQVIKMLIAIVAVFIICWAPILVNNVLIAFDILPFLHIGNVKHMREAFYVMAYANSCVNPIVYGFMSKNFRRTFRMALCRCLHGSQYIRDWTFRRQNSAPSRASHQAFCHSTDVYEMSEYDYGMSKSEV